MPNAFCYRHQFIVVSQPVNEVSINHACVRLEAMIRDSNDVHTISLRNAYIEDFVAILRSCDQQDRFRNQRWQVDETLVAAENVERLKLSRWTAGRVIRLLGDLQAEQAVEAIAEFLLLISDDDGLRGLPRVGDVPAHWALFQIGDAALPTLRHRMTSDNERIRNSAQHAVVQILGPRSLEYLQRWLDNAESERERERLAEAQMLFQIVAQNTQNKTPDEYRAELFRKGRERVAARWHQRQDSQRRMRERNEIEQLAPDDRIAFLKRKALSATEVEIPEIAEMLAQLGDFSLSPLIRERIHQANNRIPDRYVWFLCHHGEAIDFRFLRRAAGQDLETGATLASSRIFGSVASGVQTSKNPLAIPILIDFLSQRELSGARSKENEGKNGFISVPWSCADKCMEALIRLTEHNEGYAWDDPPADREAAFDRWIAWWNREGKAEFVAKHPDVVPIILEEQRKRE